MSGSELKPCPFCGGEVRIFYTMKIGIPTGDDGCQATARCSNTLHCGAEIQRWAARKDWARESAVNAWNRRANNEQRDADN